jgi:hypothetical protein
VHVTIPDRNIATRCKLSILSAVLCDFIFFQIGHVISITNASKSIGGYYSILFGAQTYSSIPAKTSGVNLAYLLQSIAGFGYASVVRTGECSRYSYRIQWLSNGEQPLISISNSTQVRPIQSPVVVQSIRRGSIGHLFYYLSNDMLRTYHRTPQVSLHLS